MPSVSARSVLGLSLASSDGALTCACGAAAAAVAGLARGQVQGQRDYLEDVVVVKRHLKNGLGELLVGVFDGHGGRCVSGRSASRSTPRTLTRVRMHAPHPPHTARWPTTWAHVSPRKPRRSMGKRRTPAPSASASPPRSLPARKRSSRPRGASPAARRAWSVAVAPKRPVWGTGAADRSLTRHGAAANIASCRQVALLQGSKLHLANVGDCRAVIVRATSFERLTDDHKVSTPSERQRILKQGGKLDGDRIVLKKYEGGNRGGSGGGLVCAGPEGFGVGWVSGWMGGRKGRVLRGD